MAGAKQSTAVEQENFFEIMPPTPAKDIGQNTLPKKRRPTQTTEEQRKAMHAYHPITRGTVTADQAADLIEKEVK